ncbi:hypothetical protein DFJ58DRAFT_845911 [Suillus subalutaceus]|uniref:uncharacterized protein n=1 Tax=Suillus subalutaceus TaxID=48586 RepID=UPI001B8668BF|nr:uncharacterized protein DFJ58DRAFT_845911 [Suillus subalutaceus]KAG1838869.1 hypothetical protein DFJ58DRAFT_845911 [Suillus subalutaceus]
MNLIHLSTSSQHPIHTSTQDIAVFQTTQLLGDPLKTSLIVAGAQPGISYTVPHILLASELFLSNRQAWQSVFKILIRQSSQNDPALYVATTSNPPLKTSVAKSPDPPKRHRTRHHASPKSVVDDPEESFATCHRPPPKPRPLAWSKCSGPMTSSAEEEIFEATPALVAEANTTAASEDPNTTTQSQSNNPNGGTSATSTESHNAGHGSNDHCKDTSTICAESHSTEHGGNDDGQKTSTTSANGCPCRSGGIKSYAPDRSNSGESSPSDSDWAAGQEQLKKAWQAAANAGVNDGDNDEGSPATDPPSPPRLTSTQKQKSKVMAEVNEHNGSKDDDDEDFVKTKGRLPQAGILKAQELGKNTLEAARALGKEYGKSVRTILIEAGLTMKATHQESPWNQHQTCGFKGLEGLMMAVCDAFTKSTNYDQGCVLAPHPMAFTLPVVAIFPGDEEAGCQASGLFAGSDMVKALINSHQLDIKHWLDELTTILNIMHVTRHLRDKRDVRVTRATLGDTSAT